MAEETERGEAPSTPMADINVTPMADVMLVLLIVFMITAPLAQHKVKVELPEVLLTQEAEKPAGVLDLAIKPNGSLYLEGALVSENELQAKLAVAAQKNPQPEVQIRAADTLRYSRIWEVMSLAKDQGIVHLGFVTGASDTNS